MHVGIDRTSFPSHPARLSGFHARIETQDLRFGFRIWGLGYHKALGGCSLRRFMVWVQDLGIRIPL